MSSQRCPIRFIEVLSLLQGLLGRELDMDISSNRLFLGASWTARLEGVETLPEDNQAVILHFVAGETIELEPSELEAFAYLDDSDRASQLEFRFERGLLLKLAPTAAPAVGR